MGVNICISLPRAKTVQRSVRDGCEFPEGARIDLR